AANAGAGTRPGLSGYRAAVPPMRLRERRGTVVDVERACRQKRRLGALGTVLLLYCGAVLAQGKADAGRNNADVDQAYQTDYASLRGYTTPVLIAELSETVEDALITGSHVSPTSKRFKVRHFEEAAYAALRARLCSAQDRSLSVGLKAVALESV